MTIGHNMYYNVWPHADVLHKRRVSILSTILCVNYILPVYENDWHFTR